MKSQITAITFLGFWLTSTAVALIDESLRVLPQAI